MWTYLLAVLIPFTAALALAPLAGLIGRRLGIVDRPEGRRAHARETPRLGGIALFTAYILALGVMAWQGSLTTGYNADDYIRLKGLLLGGIAAFLFGLIDDRFDLPPAPQFAFQFLLALIALASLLWLERFTLPVFGLVALSDYPWGPFVYIPLTVLWVMGMINTVNWLDGLDGLAAGVGAILCLVLAVHMHRQGQHSVALLPLALLGALLGFLPHNFAPARIFLGSCGAFFLGYTLGGLGLIAGGRVATALLVMGLPVVDTAWTILERLRQRRSPTQADRSHLHFRLLDLGLPQRTVVLSYWGFCALFGLLALTVSSRIYKLLALGALGIAVISLLAWLSFRRK